jgi:hypothetical protein
LDQEAVDQAVTLEDDDPQMIATVIVFLYGGTYPTTKKGAEDSAKSLEKLLSSKTQAQCGQDAQGNPLTRHASLYGVSERYQCPELKSACWGAYITSLSQNCSTSDFISSIHVVYETTPEADKGLRKWVVVFSQGYKSRLQLHPSFKALFKSRPDFIFDLTTAYMEVKYYYCPNCEETIHCDELGCVCGHSGLCGQEDSGRCGQLWDCYCQVDGVLRKGALARASENPRWKFKHEMVDKILEHMADNLGD